MNMLDYKLTKLDNGLRVITAPLEGTKAVTILILVKTGSRFETKDENGVAHFLEHMFFKGTTKRPKTIDIARELDSVGANYNAFTGEEYTGFFVRLESSHFDLGLDILHDMLENSLLNKEEIEKEKGVILEEINMIRDLPSSYVEYVMKELLWGDQPLGRMITGIPETVLKFDQNTFKNFKERYYRPENMLIVISGGDSQSWIEKVQGKFGKMPQEKPGTFEKVSEIQKQPQQKIFFKQTDQAHFILGFRSLKRTDDRRPILKVLNNIMGATMSSRLFIEVREKRGLCYYVNSDIADYIDTGFWGAAAGVDIKRITEAIEVILDEFGKLKNELVTSEELSRAKENLKGQLYLSLEESMNVAQFLAEQEMFWEEIDHPEQVIADLMEVTAEDVKELAQELFTPEKLNLAVVGPFKDEKVFQDIINKFK